MTDKKELYKIADFILNRADDGDLEVVKEALKKRLEAKNRGPGGTDINYLAHSTGDAVAKQLSSSRQQIRETVCEFVAKIIKQHAPEISDEQLKVLLDEWVGDEKDRNPFRQDPDSGRESKREKSMFPADLELKMIDQFLRFGSGRMPLEEQAGLRESIPDWQEAYWKSFTPRIRGLLTLYFKGKIDSDTCWAGIRRELFDGQQ